MGSKYDKYWTEMLPKINILIEEAFKTGYSRELDVSEIQNHGKRQYWGTRVIIPPNTTKITEELSPDAHGKSLGTTIIRSGILKNRRKTLFARISKRGRKLYLHFETLETTCKKFSTPTQVQEKTTKQFNRIKPPHFITEKIQTSIEELCEIIHKELEKLELRTEPPGKDTPNNGIYFWYEKGEIRQGGGQRVTRVGTHIKQNRLRDRIRQHYNSNREASVFRKHIGGALMQLSNEPESEIKEWYKARRSTRFKDPKFQKYEELVTKQIKSGSYRILKVEDPNTRIQLEEKLIALFSHCNHCKPSKNWLGNHAYRQEVRKSGLWNTEHTNSTNQLTQKDLPLLKQLINQTLQKETRHKNNQNNTTI